MCGFSRVFSRAALTDESFRCLSSLARKLSNMLHDKSKLLMANQLVLKDYQSHGFGAIDLDVN